MKGEWCYHKEYFSAAFCRRVIDQALNLPEVEPLIADYKVDHFVRKSKIRWIQPDNSDFKFLFDEIWNIGLSMNNQFFNLDMNLLPAMQFTEYDASYAGEYKLHQDIFWVNQTDRHRKVSLVVQLTDPSEYGGGDLQFEHVPENPPVDDIRLRGTVIAFPSFVFHKVTPVTRGKRYSLVAWFEGPKFK